MWNSARVLLWKRTGLVGATVVGTAAVTGYNRGFAGKSLEQKKVESVSALSSSSSSSTTTDLKVLATSSHGRDGPMATTTATTLVVPSEVPSSKAVARGLRLLSTACRIAIDYQLAKLEKKYGLLLPSSHPTDSLTEEQRTELGFWEEELARRREALDYAQRVYAKPAPKEEKGDDHEPEEDGQEEGQQQLSDGPTEENDDAKVDLTVFQARVLAKKKEKQAMMEAAQRLAQAEDKVLELGGSRHNWVHQKAANRLLQLCRESGGVYIKIGQHLANLDYILPTEYIQTLSSLFDDTPTTDYEQVRQVIQEDLGATPEELFEEFESEPLASASLAQVHVAYDKETGRKLAIKVQHAGLRDTALSDLQAALFVVHALERLFPEFSYGWIATEIAPHLPRELDFVNEGKNAERAAANLALTGLDCIVPRVLWETTSARVLTMEFEEGFAATDTEAMEQAQLRKFDVARLISSVFASQVFLTGAHKGGWVHCDPHPGNVLIRPKAGGKHGGPRQPQLVLLDHGLYRDLDDDFRIKYANLWKSLMLADLEGIREACASLGVEKAYMLFAAMITSRPFDEIVERSKQGTLSKSTNSNPNSRADQEMMKGYAQKYLKQIFDLIATLPKQMLLLLKMNDCLRHIDHSLGSPANSLLVCGRFAAAAVYENEFKTSSTWYEKWTAWLRYLHVLVRIQIHDIGVWWLHRQQQVAPQHGLLSG